MIILWIVGLFLLSGCHGEENVYQVNTKKVQSVVDEDFIGYTTDLSCLRYQRCLEGLRNISSQAKDKIYVKMHGLDNPPNYDFLLAIKDLTRSSKIVPVIVLNYKANDWEPRQHLKLLQKINKLGVKNCLFQLGADLYEEDIFTYTDDLSTFRFMIDAFKKFNNTWKVTGSDLIETLPLPDARIYTKLARNYVTSFNWKQGLNSSAADLSPTIQHLVDESYLPVSVTYRRHSFRSHDLLKCDHKCVSEGLRWAGELGEIAKKGFSSVFRPVSRRDFLYKNFGDYIDEIYLKLMGPIVLNVKTISDQASGNVHAQCSKENPGGLVLMAVNPAEKSMKMTTKFPGVKLGKMIKEVILRPENDRIYLNDHLLDGISIDAAPVDLEKLTQDEMLSLSLPARSVGFWEIPGANATICREIEDMNTKPKVRQPADSSMTKLLQELIQEISLPSNDVESHKRARRSLPRLFPQKRDVSDKLKQILGLFNKKIRGIQGFPAGVQSPQFGQTTAHGAQAYSTYQKPMIYTVPPQGPGTVYDSPIQMTPEMFAQYFGEQSMPPVVKPQKKMQQKKYQASVQKQKKPAFSAQATFSVQPPYAQESLPTQQSYAAQSSLPIQAMFSGQPSISILPASADDLADQGSPFTGQIVPGQTYHLSEQEAATYLTGYGGDQNQQQPIEYTMPQIQSYGNAEPIYLNSYQDGQISAAQGAYQDLSSLTQSSQGFVFPTSSRQGNQMAYVLDSQPWAQKETPVEMPKPESSKPAQKIVTSFLAGQSARDEPKVHIQMNKNDPIQLIGRSMDDNVDKEATADQNPIPSIPGFDFNLRESPKDEYPEELSILSQLGYHELTKIDEKDLPHDVIRFRRRRSVFSDREGRKRNILDMDLFPVSLEESESAVNGNGIENLKSSLDEMLNFFPRALKKTPSDSNPHLQSIQTDSKDMKKQCKILSVAMENECLHDTIDDIRSLAKRAVKYISRKKFYQFVDWMVPQKLMLKKRRFMRSPLSAPWSLEEDDLPISLKDLEDALKTNKIFPMKPAAVPKEETSKSLDPIASVKAEETKTASEEQVGEIHQSLHDFVTMMNSHIMSWWNLFA